MKNKKNTKNVLKSLAFFSILCLAYPSYSEEPKPKTQVINGSADLQDKHFGILEVNGSFNFENLTVDHTLSINGFMQGNNLVCGTLKVNGSAEIKNIKANQAVIYGSFAGQGIHIEKDLTVHGNLSAKDVTVSGDTHVEGALKIEEGRMNHIQATGVLSTFSNSQIKSIVIKEVGHGFWGFFGLAGNKTQIIELKGPSIVSGDITFESGNGEVHLFNNAEVKGKISGGKVIKK